MALLYIMQLVNRLRLCLFIKCGYKENFVIMKKSVLYFAVMMLILPLAMISCNDDDDYPVVKVSIDIDGGVQSNGNLYIRQDDEFKIKDVSIVRDASTPGAMIAHVNYYWDQFLVGQVYRPPFPMTFNIGVQRLGLHYLTVQSMVLAEGYSVVYCNVTIPVIVVPHDFDYGELDPDDNQFLNVTPNLTETGEQR